LKNALHQTVRKGTAKCIARQITLTLCDHIRNSCQNLLSCHGEDQKALYEDVEFSYKGKLTDECIAMIKSTELYPE
jgi:hypothetical protein